MNSGVVLKSGLLVSVNSDGLLAVDPALTVAWSRDPAGFGPRGVAVQQEEIEATQPCCADLRVAL